MQIYIYPSTDDVDIDSDNIANGCLLCIYNVPNTMHELHSHDFRQSHKYLSLITVINPISQLMTLRSETLDIMWKAMQLEKAKVHWHLDSLTCWYVFLFVCLPSFSLGFLGGHGLFFYLNISMAQWCFGIMWVLNEHLWNETSIPSPNLACNFHMENVSK